MTTKRMLQNEITQHSILNQIEKASLFQNASFHWALI